MLHGRQTSARCRAVALPGAWQAQPARLDVLEEALERPEAIKLQIGSAAPLAQELTMDVRGRHLATGLPTEVQLHSEEVRDAIRTPIEEVLRAISETLEDTPPELAGDIAREGILLAGGGTLLRGLPQLVTQRTGMAVWPAESPLTCVAIGAGLALDHLDQLATSRPRR